MTNTSPYYNEFAPPHSMAHLIGAFWLFSLPDHDQLSGSVQYRVVPDGCMDLIFQYQRSTSGEIYNPQLTVYGATDRFSLVNIKPATEVVGVRFNPGMAGRFLALKPIELFQQSTRAQDCAEAFVRLFDQLCECNSTQQVLSALQISLSQLQQANYRNEMALPIRAALRLLANSNGRISVSQLAEAVGVSERTLRRGMTDAVGLSPKVLARILRFQHTVSRLRSPEPPDLCCVALECGYADQAHMGREFQQLAGLTPATFIA